MVIPNRLNCTLFIGLSLLLTSYPLLAEEAQKKTIIIREPAPATTTQIEPPSQTTKSETLQKNNQDEDVRRFEHVELPARKIPPEQSDIDNACKYYDAINDWRCEQSALKHFYINEQIEVEFKGIEAPSLEIKRHQQAAGNDCVIGLNIQFKASQNILINWLETSLLENGIAKGVRPDFLPEAFDVQQARPTTVEAGALVKATLIPNHETCLAPLTLEHGVSSHETRITLPFTMGDEKGFIRWTRTLSTEEAYELEALRMRSPPIKPASFYPWRSLTGLGLVVVSGALIGVPALINGIESGDTGFVAAGAVLGVGGLALLGYGVYKEVPEYRIFREKMDRYETYQDKILLQE